MTKICTQPRKPQDLFALFVTFKAALPDKEFDLQSRQHLQGVMGNLSFGVQLILVAFSVLLKILSMINYRIKYLWFIKSQEHCHKVFFHQNIPMFIILPLFHTDQGSPWILIDYRYYSLSLKYTQCILSHLLASPQKLVYIQPVCNFPAILAILF